MPDIRIMTGDDFNKWPQIFSFTKKSTKKDRNFITETKVDMNQSSLEKKSGHIYISDLPSMQIRKKIEVSYICFVNWKKRMIDEIQQNAHKKWKS